MTALNMQQALDKMAARGNVATPVKTAPAGQPKVAPAPGNSGNATTASGNPTVAPGPVAHSNATSASGKPKLDTAPENGAKGKSDEGTLAMCKNAGFAMGIVKAAAEAKEEAEAVFNAEVQSRYAEELNASGVDPEIVDALVTLEAHGIDIEMPGEFTEKVAACQEKVARFYFKEDEMAEGFKARDSRDTDAKAKAKGVNWALKGMGIGAMLGAGIGAAAAGKGKRLTGMLAGLTPGTLAGSVIGDGAGQNAVREKAYHEAAMAKMKKNEGKS